MPGSRDKILALSNGLLGLVFALSAAVQYNDPDPLRWAILYGSAALACLLFGLGRASRLLTALVCGASLLWAALLAPRVLPQAAFRDLFRSMKAQTPSIELSRELLGLLIVAGWMALLLLQHRARAR
jgi:hypothetical protein